MWYDPGLTVRGYRSSGTADSTPMLTDQNCGVRMPTLEERFWSKVEMIPFHPCWEWMGFRNEWGYGQVAISHRSPERAHRLSWIIHYGPIPRGLFVCHRCDNPGCVRPDHLFLGTTTDNMRDMISKGRANISAAHEASREKERRRVSCNRGHPHSAENTTVRPDGKRQCKVCSKVSQRLWYERKKMS